MPGALPRAWLQTTRLKAVRWSARLSSAHSSAAAASCEPSLRPEGYSRSMLRLTQGPLQRKPQLQYKHFMGHVAAEKHLNEMPCG